MPVCICLSEFMSRGIDRHHQQLRLWPFLYSTHDLNNEKTNQTQFVQLTIILPAPRVSRVSKDRTIVYYANFTGHIQVSAAPTYCCYFSFFILNKMAGNSPYVRDALPLEYEEVALVIARAFHNDPLMNWMGSVPQKIVLPSRSSMDPAKLTSVSKQLEILYYFHHSLVLATHMVNGRIMGVFRKDDDGRDILTAACLWLPPNVRVDTPWIILRSKQYRTMFGSWRRPGGWGLTGLKVRRITLEA